jgi:tetratricopeptide (TPR) repeat protein
MQAENQEKHVDYLAKASQLALQNGNYKEVLQYYENPLTVEEGKNASPLEEASRNRQLAQAYYGLGQLPLAKEKLKNALEILEKKTEVTRSGFSLRKSLQGLFRAQETENNDNIVSSRETRNELAQIHRLLADLAYWANDAQVWENEASASIKEIEKITSAREIAKTHAVYANVTRVAGHTRNSQKHYEIAADSLSRILGKADQAEAMMRLAELDLIDGRWLPAERLLTRAVRNALQTGASQHFGSSLGMLHRFFHLRGFFIQSVQSAQGILDVAQRSDNQLQTGWGLAGMAEGLLRLGRWEQAVARAHESLKFRPAQDRLTGLVVAGVLTNGYLQRGSADRALEQAYQTHEVLAKAKPTSLHMLEVYCGLAEIYLHATRIGRPADAKQRLIDILRWFDEYAKVFPVARPRSLMYQGRAHLLSGDMERAISAWKQGAQLAFSQGLLYDFGLCAFELGAKSSLPTREKREFRLRALDMFTRLGLKSEVSQLRALK